MTTTIGLVANIFNERHALPGWLETHTQFFDDVRVYHAGPQGSYSDDGTIEILEQWKIPIEYGAIDEGFGVVRTKAIRMSPCDFVMILDADERFFHMHQVMSCGGESPQAEEDVILQSYDFRDLNTVIPNWENISRLGARLSVSYGEAYNQGAWLRSVIEHGDLDAVRTVRRHWHDFTWRRPTKNWHTDPDFQTRLVRNKDSIYFDPGVKMHEQLRGASNVYHPNFTHGPFFDHFHLHFKKMEVWQRGHDVKIYDSIHAGEKPPTREEFDPVKH